ncbi:hypothetical protein cym2001_41850 [Pseudomonas sp. CYM-20-01]|nr:hypothetical protein cym2001_41850 [Pseudomonas sp. CYM-20-01]
MSKWREETTTVAHVAELKLKLWPTAGSLWEGMAITLMGGLVLGTLVTLGLIPVLLCFVIQGNGPAWLTRCLSG